MMSSSRVLYVLLAGADWEPWSACTKTCGKGEQTRYAYANGSLAYIEKASCGVVPCAHPYANSTWTECTEPCGSGERERANDNGTETQTMRCNTHPCDAYEGTCRGDIIIVLDSSASIVDRNWYIEKQFAIDVIKGLKVSYNETHVGVISYSTTVQTILELNETYVVDEIVDKVWGATHIAGLTSLAAALKVMRQMFDDFGRDDSEHIAVFVSDAVPNVDYNDTIPEAEAAKAEGVQLFFVGSGRMDYDMMVELASSPEEVYVMNVSDITAIQNLTERIDTETCSATNRNKENVVTTPGLPEIPDCSKCDYTRGQVWLPHVFNCHAFILCEPVGNGEYLAHEMTCGDLYWSQEYHTCVLDEPTDRLCLPGIVVPTDEPENETIGECPYEAFPGDSSKFWIPGDVNSVQQCNLGMNFMLYNCTCDVIDPEADSCSSDMLLHFPFDDHFNDVTCNRAVSTVYGGVSIENDTMRGNVACFNETDHLVVDFMRHWFAGRDVEAFSISVWVRREPGGNSKANIVQNGECEVPSFHITTENGTLYGGIRTDYNMTLDGSAANNGEWHHATWVYNGVELLFYIDGILVESGAISGFMANTDAPMYIGQCCGEGFTGCMDEVCMKR
ncbi:hypothetical protein LSAT2_007249 [Lamellibrachia satsuma]|nr:hypothetical protein LSAT2_007249 [Lamellibrachia satsuma]